MEGGAMANDSARDLVGAHTTCFEEPDIIFMRLVGEVSKEEGMEMNRRHRHFGEGRHHVFFLIDLERLTKIDPEVRKVATETLRDVPLRGMALYRAPLKAKVIAKLIITALNMFKKDASTNPVIFADTEEEEIPPDRLQKVIEALSYATVDEFASCLDLLRSGDGVEDEFAELETAFTIFVEELADAKTALKEALAKHEAANRELEARLETIEMQQAAIRDLSTPIIEVWAGVLCLPVVGIVDSQRSAEMTETLLETIVAKQARLAIVDITGIDVMDTKTADHFIKMAKAVRLLGAECIISGINPGIAQTLTHIGVDLTGMRTMRNLRDALQLHLRETEQIEHGRRKLEG
jgi:rsbT co-antagonist protein RsbR